MTRLTGVLVLMVVILCVLADQEKVTLEVHRGQDKNILGTKGSSVKLTCTTKYDVIKCSLVHVTWHRLFGEATKELTDPNKYFSTVSETDCDDMRCRQVVTEILNLTTEDAGMFQCKAECEQGAEESAMGHIITIEVKG